jgi:Helix-turn-helix domain
VAMRFRLHPNDTQEVLLAEQCGRARYVWNLALEQALLCARWKGPTPGFNAQAAQLTQARAAESWLACGSQTVQQQPLRDLDQGWRQFFAGTHRRPTWRKAGEDEGLRIVGPQGLRVRRDNRARCSVLVGEGRLGLFQTQPRTGRMEVVPHHSRAGGSLAYRVRGGPRSDPCARHR